MRKVGNSLNMINNNLVCLLLPATIFLISIKKMEAAQQTCIFSNDQWLINSYDGPKRSFYQCEIVNQQLLNATEEITTNTSSNIKSNSDVETLWYNGGSVKYFPSSIFTIFPNMEHFLIEQWNGFEDMKPEYLTNANNLKVFRVHNNKLKRLGANLFALAPNLLNINLRDNTISDIHRLTFNGLTQLQGVYLQNNEISNIHPETFKNLIHLQTLYLSGSSNCVSKIYSDPNEKVKEVQIDILTSCDYVISDQELQEIEFKEIAVEENAKLILELKELKLKHQKLIENYAELENNQSKLISTIKSLTNLL